MHSVSRMQTKKEKLLCFTKHHNEDRACGARKRQRGGYAMRPESHHPSRSNLAQEAAKTTPSGDRLYFCSGVPCNWAAGRGFSSTSQIPSWHSDMGASDMRSKGWRVCSQWRSDGLPVGGTDSLTLPNRSRAAASHGCGLATFPVSGGPGAGSSELLSSPHTGLSPHTVAVLT